jgi:hypothetical protein
MNVIEARRVSRFLRTLAKQPSSTTTAITTAITTATLKAISMRTNS